MNLPKFDAGWKSACLRCAHCAIANVRPRAGVWQTMNCTHPDKRHRNGGGGGIMACSLARVEGGFCGPQAKRALMLRDTA